MFILWSLPDISCYTGKTKFWYFTKIMLQ